MGKAYTSEEKERLLTEAKAARSPAIYPALMLALNAGMRDAEIRTMQWERLDLSKAYLTVGDSKTEAGEGRTIPLNTALVEALVEYSKWYTERFGTIQPDWYVFAFGKPWPKDPTRPMVTLKTSWKNVKRKAKVTGRWHDNRHTFITGLAESGEAGDETIRDMAGHVSKQMLKHYSHIGMEAKRRAVESLVSKKADTAHPRRPDGPPEAEMAKILEGSAKDSTKVAQMNLGSEGLTGGKCLKKFGSPRRTDPNSRMENSAGSIFSRVLTKTRISEMRSFAMEMQKKSLYLRSPSD